jgi:hypothetical protein
MHGSDALMPENGFTRALQNLRERRVVMTCLCRNCAGTPAGRNQYHPKSKTAESLNQEFMYREPDDPRK